MFRNPKLRQRLDEILIGFSFALLLNSIWSSFDNNPNSVNYNSCWWLLCLMIGSLLMRRRRSIHKAASKILSEDKRPPVIYLRSFKDDQITSRAIQESESPVMFTEEEYLMDVLNDFGPCIAIGQPGEKLPDLGAARIYLDDDEWQDKVSELLTSSKLVVLRAGSTQNFLWEVDQSIKNARATSLLILVPKLKNTYEQFYALTSKDFPKLLPENIGKSDLFSGVASLYGYIYFDEDWTPHFTKFGFHIPFWQRWIHVTTHIIRSSLAPIYTRFGMPVPKAETNFSVVIAAFLLSALGLFILNR